MKRKMFVLLTILAMICVFVCVAGCEKNTPQEEEHVHTYSDKWTSDGESHWHAASCGHDVIKDKSMHDWDGGVVVTSPLCTDDGVRKYTCSTCLATKTESISKTGHSYSSELSSDEASHWYASTCGHDVKKEETAHIYENNSEICSVCKYDSSRGLTFEFNTTNTGFLPANSYLVTGLKEGNEDENIVIPSLYKGLPVTGMAQSAFSECSNMTSIEIPSSIKWINSGILVKSNALKSITISPENTVYRSQGNCIIEIATNKLLKGCNNSVIPSGVTSIEANAFEECAQLTDVDIPQSVTSIGGGAFRRCSALKNLNIPVGVTSIGSSAFAGCSGLERVEISVNVMQIYASAFLSCGQAKFYCEVASQPVGWKSTWKPSANSVEWGYNNIKSNSEYDYVVHENDAYLTKYKGNDVDIEVPASIDSKKVKSIGAIFAGKDITSIKIPSGVTEIGGSAFSNCANLETVELPNGITSIDSKAFEKCVKLTDISLPSTVANIGSSAFADCSSLSSIVIPQAVTTIGSYAFTNNGTITIYCEASERPYNWSSLWYNNSEATIVWGFNGN